jgi:hypothetical protein
MNQRNILHFLKFKKSKSSPPEGKNDLVVEPEDPRSGDGSDFLDNMRRIDKEFEDYWQSRRRNVSIG